MRHHYISRGFFVARISWLRAVGVVALLLPTILWGGVSRQWVGLDTSDDWSEADNWSSSNVPGDANETAEFAGANAGTTSINIDGNLRTGGMEFNSNLSVSSLTFTNAANELSIRGGIFSTGISNNSSKVITFQNKMGIEDDKTWSSTNVSGGSMVFQNTVDTDGFDLRFETTNAVNTITVSGNIIDGGSIIKTGAGTLNLSGTTANTFSGGFDINAGTVNLNKTAGVNAVGTGTVTIGDGVGAANSAVLALQNNHQMADSTDVVINSDGQLHMGSATDAISTIAGTGQINLGTGRLIIGGDNSSSTFGGTIAGTGTLAKNGSGTLTLTNDIAYNGTLELGGGTLKLDNIDLDIAQLYITADSTIDFSTVSSRIFLDSLTFLNDSITLNIINWDKHADFFYSTAWVGATQDVWDNMGSKPESQIIFDGWSGNDTGWDSYDDQIYPNVPEPSTYGLILTAFATVLFAFKHFKKRKQ